MNPHKTILRLIILTQVFTLFALLLMPTLIRLLDQTAGKVLYFLLVLIAAGLVMALRYALAAID